MFLGASITERPDGRYIVRAWGVNFPTGWVKLEPQIRTEQRPDGWCYNIFSPMIPVKYK